MSLEDLQKAIIDFDENADKLADDLIKKKVAPEKILAAVGEILNKVGEKYEKHEFYLAELMLCGDVAKSVIEKILPIIKQNKVKLKGNVIFGTVEGDIHDIGKTIIGSFLIGAGFNVIDLGVEVTASQFIKAVKKFKPDIIAMSTLLSTTALHVPKIIYALKKEGIRAKILIGGRPINEEFAKKAGADGYGQNPTDAIKICNAFMEELVERD
ncbi:MAG: cobalamin-binding protein [Candidatus Lokiarchaeota archaeon]|nr:cobalamin-binding protein [Candidatus Lokiarchaeota archaeon]